MNAPVVALLHTADVHVATFDRLFAELAPAVRVAHLVRDDLLAEAEAAGSASDDLICRAGEALATHAADSGAAAAMCTCSTIGAAADHAGVVSDIPCLRVDRALAEAVLSTGPEILIAACVPTTVAPTRNLFRNVAREIRPDARFTELLIAEAWPHFQAGDMDRYAETIAAHVRDAVAGRAVDAVALAQASMAPASALLADIGIPVLASLEIGVRVLAGRIGQGTDRTST